MGHMAKDCRVRVYNVAEATEQQSTDQQQQHYYEEQHNQQQYDPKYQQWSEQEAWQYEQQWFPEQQAQEYTQQQAPTLQQAQAVSSVKVEELFVASVTRSACLFAKLWCRLPTTETYSRGDTTTALSYRWATQEPWVQMDQVLQQTRKTNGDSLWRVWRDTTPNRQRYKVAGARL